MARRGEALSEHILFAAKEVFLEMGFERASMDAVAARAETSKRTLYAHFENKERLFLAVIDLVCTLFLGRLGNPADHATEPAEALTQFGARYLDTLLYGPSVRMSRMIVAEAERFSEGAAKHFETVFDEPAKRISGYISEKFSVDPQEADRAAEAIVGRVIYPRFVRCLAGLDAPREKFAETITPQFAAPVRQAVKSVLEGLPGRA